ncbi:helix-turn-helix domain-containing protein [Arthrobacter woluwensis]|uniref:helix-turn-helix domain-containing protein n=1 Tax=Arthrobacter woluwensis TaxID=156980 RepID=UPI0011A60A1F|nr:helix-turn-helix domain-containing protein [Arthrobacter woluwensis]
MSFQAMTWAMEVGKTYNLPSSTRFVLLSMANYADQRGNNVFPSLATLEEDTGLSENTIRAQIRRLKTLRLIERGDASYANAVIRRGGYQPNVWRLCMGDEPMVKKAPRPVDNSASRGATAEALKNETPQNCGGRGATRGAVVAPEPKNQSIEPAPAQPTTSADAAEPVESHTTHGPDTVACSSCNKHTLTQDIDLNGWCPACARGAEFMAQIRARRLKAVP